jgi:hypothetical protein
MDYLCGLCLRDENVALKTQLAQLTGLLDEPHLTNNRPPAAKQLVALIAEEFDELIELDPAQVDAYLDGYRHGGGKYGAGACYGVRVPQDLAELSPRERQATEAALARWQTT